MIFGKHINKYYLKYLPRLLLGILALAVVDWMQLRIPELYRTLIDAMTPGSGVTLTPELLIDGVCAPMLIIIFAIVFGRFLWRICLFGAGIRVETDLRAEMFDRSKDLSQQYYQVNKVGNLMSLYTNDLETVHDCFGSGVMMTFDTVVQGAMAIVKMFSMDPVLSLLSLIPLLLLLLASTLIGNYMTGKWNARQEAFSDLSDFTQESFSGVSVVKAFVKEGKELLAFRRLNRHNEDANVTYTRASVLLNICVTLFVESVISIILGYGGYLVYRGRFTAGQLVEFIGYFNMTVWPIMAVSELIEKVSKGRASLGRISELLDAEPDVKDGEDVSPIPPIRGDIEFRGLTFRYPGAEYDALKNVSFTVKAGENVGIIGRTGAGKTTLVDLILRTYNVPDGTLFIDGRDVNSFPIRTLRDFAAYVPQDNFLFSDTIANNISFALDRTPGDVGGRIAQAAVLADVDGNIRDFPKGYETMLGERGVTVSGGQKQRISIARALMKEASVLILDDSVSAVDTSTERTILDNLRRTRAGKTTLLIAHRISTVCGMDKILLLDEGRILAYGSHEELCRTSPEYRKMVELQRLEDENRDGEKREGSRHHHG